MTTSNPLRLPHSARKALLTGPTITLVLPMPSIGMTHTIPSLPRRMLFAFSHLAAAQLTVADGINTNSVATTPATPSFPSSLTSSSSSQPSLTSSSSSQPPSLASSSSSSQLSSSSSQLSSSTQPSRTITLPPDSCAPAALELLVQWLKQSCRNPHHPSSLPLPADWRQLLRVYTATRALRVAALEVELRNCIEVRLRAAPLTPAQFADAVDALAGGIGGNDGEDENGRLVRELVRKTAAWARKDSGVEAEEMKAWLARSWPGLVEMWEACDRMAAGGRKLDVRWVEEMKLRLEVKARRRSEEVEREEEEAEKKKNEVLESKVKDFEERLQRQRRLAGLSR